MKQGALRVVAVISLFWCLTGCSTSGVSPSDTSITHTDAANQKDIAWLDKTAVAQAAAIQRRELTSEALVRGYLARIHDLDDKINAVISINPDVLQEARDRDEAIAEGRSMGPLHGLPVLVKDNIETRELPTTAGSMALINNDTGRDAPIITRLRAAGAIVLGKTNLSEWANFRSGVVHKRVERGRRADPQSSPAKPHCLRLFIGIGRGNGCQAGVRGYRNRDQRLYNLSVGNEWRRRF